MGPGQLLARFRARLGLPAPPASLTLSPVSSSSGRAGRWCPRLECGTSATVASWPPSRWPPWAARSRTCTAACPRPRAAQVSPTSQSSSSRVSTSTLAEGGSAPSEGRGRRGERGLTGAGSVPGMCPTASHPGHGLTGDPARGGCSASPQRRSDRGGGV